MYPTTRITSVVVAFAIIASGALAAEPGSGTLSPDSSSVGWTGGPFLVSNPAACVPGGPACDTFQLTLVPPSQGDYVVEITTASANDGDDYDLFVFDSEGNQVGSAATASGNEKVTLVNPPADTYDVVVQPFLVAAGSTYDGQATLSSVTLDDPRLAPRWSIVHHGECCEGNLASSGDTTYVLLPELLTGNDIRRSFDGGLTWETVYPPVDISVPFGIEGDLQAFGNDVIFFGTEVSHGVAARSDDRGTNWTVVQIPVAFTVNDQAWSYIGPGLEVCPVQTEPYVLTGWYRIGSVALFSCDGGLTWPIQTPLVGVNGSGPMHVMCEEVAHEPVPGGDTRVANPNFARMKSGRHGGWGPDGRFYWSQISGGNLFVCATDNFGATWSGVRHPLPAGTPGGVPVTHLAFDQNGTLYVLHSDKLYVSFDRGESFSFVHTLPRWGDDPTVGDGGSGQFFVVDDGTIHIGLKTEGSGGTGEIHYLRGKHVDNPNPGWKDELVDVVDAVRLDFMQITLNAQGEVTIGYTTPPDFDNGVTTASRSGAR